MKTLEKREVLLKWLNLILLESFEQKLKIFNKNRAKIFKQKLKFFDLALCLKILIKSRNLLSFSSTNVGILAKFFKTKSLNRL